ncbi:MAG: electron transfer flavoprotein subunit beta/FixA family protein [Myxococcales bacterium FL481]|nr:MAG: electron transfer flavoprotein subunit beta/FixA family protein [Myxococcales bacterium FL481]
MFLEQPRETLTQGAFARKLAAVAVYGACRHARLTVAPQRAIHAQRPRRTPVKILVPIKRIPDPDATVKFANGALDLSGAKWVPNTFDEYAVETALRLAEHVGGSSRLAEVIVLSICPAAQRQHVTQALAMGAERGVVVDCDDRELDSITVSKLIAAVATREQADLVIAGKLSQDNEGGQIAQRVAGLLNRPQACFAAEVEWQRDANALLVKREVDDGVESKKIPLPAVLNVDLRVVLPTSVHNGATPADHKYQDGPRLASLRGITMAKRKKVEVLTPDALGVVASATESEAGVTAPPARASGQIVNSVEELVNKLATEAKVL